MLSRTLARVIPSVERVLFSLDLLPFASFLRAPFVRVALVLLDLVEMRLLQRQQRALLLGFHGLRIGTR